MWPAPAPPPGIYGAPAPLPGMYGAPAPPPPGAPVPVPPKHTYTPLDVWQTFVKQTLREPNSPSELQEWSFFTPAYDMLTYFQSYCIFMGKSSNETKKNQFRKMNTQNSESFLVLKSENADKFQWINKNIIKRFNSNKTKNISLFPFPNLNKLWHEQSDKYYTDKLSKSSKAPMAPMAPMATIPPTCKSGHILVYMSSNELVQKHPNYFNGYFTGYVCDKCRQTFKYKYSNHCSLCQYDLCSACYKTTPVLDLWNPLAAPLPGQPITPVIIYRFQNANKVQDYINEYENRFIYDNLYQYIIYNKDIFNKLKAFNTPKPLSTSRISTLNSKHSTKYFMNEINNKNNNLDLITITTYPYTICYKIENEINNNKLHNKLKTLLNEYSSNNNSDIDIRAMTDKAGSLKTRKWTVVGIVDPDKHLSTLNHSTKFAANLFNNECISYYHWIPSVFKVNNDLTSCQLLSEIPNLDPYKFKNTLYPLISQLFLSFVKQFEYITFLNLRGYELQCVIKIQDYVINNIKSNDKYCYYGNFHKEGLYEDIMCVGLYYYDISSDIIGGELELTSIQKPDGYYAQKRFVSHSIKVSEGTQIAFNNCKCFHRVQKLYGNGNRKIIAFHLINPNNRLISGKSIIVNYKYHTVHYIKYYCRILLNNDNIKFIYDITVLYVTGDKKYVNNATEMHNQCRRNFSKSNSSHDILGTVNFYGGAPAPMPD